MSAFHESHEFGTGESESRFSPDVFLHAGEYLKGELARHGSFEALALDIQHEYAEEDGNSKGQLYQLLRTARFFANSMNSVDQQELTETTNAIYAGSLVAMTVVDYATGRANNVPQSIQAMLTERTNTTWKTVADAKLAKLREAEDYEAMAKFIPFPSKEESYTLNYAVAQHAWHQAIDFSDEVTQANIDAHQLLMDLIQDLPVRKVELVQAGYWMVLKQWLSPDYRNDDITRDLVNDQDIAHVSKDSGAFAEITAGLEDEITTDDSYDDDADIDPEDWAPGSVVEQTAEMIDELESDEDLATLAAFEEELAADNIELDGEEWNRESLEDFRKAIALEAMRLKAQYPSIAEMAEEEILDSHGAIYRELNAFAKERFPIVQDDVVYVYGSYIGLANTAIGRVLHEGEFLQPDEVQYAHQSFTQEDYAKISGTDDPIVEYELRGTYDKIIMIQALPEKLTHTIDVSQTNLMDPEMYQRGVPSIRLTNVSMVDMNRGEAVDYLHDIIIPLTHSGQVLGRFVPPPADED